ncbi:aminoglycoside phosphotransferase family protein [Paenibacillus lycopersici]|uniref:Aminoglycoside phosphotransferase family protein n=1 Tax=Paenibacillus lycopersici TaxID=2704462 RepID=A0A6C0FQY9_9BACL|nr:aminoglycoside phosphotransferase family protein [Paenibacillus lycopersici]QHT59297.1 aminoglycoside phosphotransferase family protein [Paenibacillus lycopersici]
MIDKLLQEIFDAQALPQAVDRWSELQGGTNSTVRVIGNSDNPRLYVVKANEPEVIAAETRFYRHYPDIELFPSIRCIDPDYRYYIYEFLPGDTSYDRKSKPELMAALTDRIISRYVQPDKADPFAWVEDPASIAGDIAYARSVIGERLSEADHELVPAIQSRRSDRLSRQPRYVLHGDFGVHNFLFQGGRLQGVIDPLPQIGRPLYDLLYAFCSSPDDLHLPVLVEAVRRAGLAPAHQHELIEDMLMALYFRISTCLTHHGGDFDRYREAWTAWTKLVPDGRSS